MAILEPAIIRSGLLPADTWTMTIGEMLTTIRERGREKEDFRKYLDLLNGQNCAITLISHAPKATVRIRDFMITKEKPRGGGKYGRRTRRIVGSYPAENR